MQCENCGADLPEGVKTCVKCGMRTDISAFAVNVGAPKAKPTPRHVRPPQKSGLLRPAIILLVILFVAWLVFLWLSSR